MPEYQQYNPEFDPKEIERVINELICIDIEPAAEQFQTSNLQGGRMNISIETEITLGGIPTEQLLSTINDLISERQIPCFLTGLSVNEKDLSMSFEVLSKEKSEPTEETIRRTFSGTCGYCKAIISVEADVPLSAHGKVKKDKNGKYQDWDLGLRECSCVSESGEPRLVYLFFRERLPG